MSTHTSSQPKNGLMKKWKNIYVKVLIDQNLSYNREKIMNTALQTLPEVSLQFFLLKQS